MNLFLSFVFVIFIFSFLPKKTKKYPIQFIKSANWKLTLDLPSISDI